MLLADETPKAQRLRNPTHANTILVFVVEQRVYEMILGIRTNPIGYTPQTNSDFTFLKNSATNPKHRTRVGFPSSSVLSAVLIAIERRRDVLSEHVSSGDFR